MVQERETHRLEISDALARDMVLLRAEQALLLEDERGAYKDSRANSEHNADTAKRCM